MPSSPKNDDKLVEQQPLNNERQPYQRPDIVYEGKISIRAGSPTSFSINEPGSPFDGPK